LKLHNSRDRYLLQPPNSRDRYLLKLHNSRDKFLLQLPNPCDRYLLKMHNSRARYLLELFNPRDIFLSELPNPQVPPHHYDGMALDKKGLVNSSATYCVLLFDTVTLSLPPLDKG
jgi:hypothetical protein